MPLVLAMSETTESGHAYADVPYVSYEYPRRYRNLVTEGEAFVYYRGRRMADGGTQPQVYLGTGVVGPIRESPDGDRLICAVLDGMPFAAPLPFKSGEGAYLEPGGTRRGFFQPGVRRIEQTDFETLLRAADVEARRLASSDRGPAPNTGHGSSGYATPEDARAVEAYSRRVAAAWIEETYSASVVQMPQNNPGFDLRVTGAPFVFVEVKGTRRPAPWFFVSEGERLFAQAKAADYLFVVVYGIDLYEKSHASLVHSTALPPLKPAQWVGLLDDSGSGAT
ncbi:protein NO VEIN domain-containing protein [Patulibacter americanus]|uniref:protein NO VEIN domain-containing protein n=1 Tax=Patulibacter americanus TaxID=588672 RepID=UPI0003B68925|nr:DUF3883 domain-containing protein [Patulibacter americanus]